MKHYEYEWDLYADRIILDSELPTDKIGWRGGDYFKFINVNGQQMLVKVDVTEKFLIDGTQKKE
jgi:hypothetical protein